MKPLSKVTCLRAWECNGGHAEPTTPVVYRKTGEVIPQEQIDRFHPKYLGYLRAHLYVTIETLKFCDRCGHALDVVPDDEVPIAFNVAT